MTQSEYSTKVFYWAGEAHLATDADELMATLATAGWARGSRRDLPAAGAVLALCELFPDLVGSWTSAWPELFERIRRALKTDTEREEWNDFHLAGWFFLRRVRRDEGVEIIDKLLDREASGGEVGRDCTRIMSTLAANCKPFEVALQNARIARRQAMVIQ